MIDTRVYYLEGKKVTEQVINELEKEIDLSNSNLTEKVGRCDLIDSPKGQPIFRPGYGSTLIGVLVENLEINNSDLYTLDCLDIIGKVRFGKGVCRDIPHTYDAYKGYKVLRSTYDSESNTQWYVMETYFIWKRRETRPKSVKLQGGTRFVVTGKTDSGNTIFKLM